MTPLGSNPPRNALDSLPRLTRAVVRRSASMASQTTTTPDLCVLFYGRVRYQRFTLGSARSDVGCVESSEHTRSAPSMVCSEDSTHPTEQPKGRGDWNRASSTAPSTARSPARHWEARRLDPSHTFHAQSWPRRSRRKWLERSNGCFDVTGCQERENLTSKCWRSVAAAPWSRCRSQNDAILAPPSRHRSQTHAAPLI